jgi:hypothetical protein
LKCATKQPSFPPLSPSPAAAFGHHFSIIRLQDVFQRSIMYYSSLAWHLLAQMTATMGHKFIRDSAIGKRPLTEGEWNPVSCWADDILCQVGEKKEGDRTNSFEYCFPRVELR